MSSPITNIHLPPCRIEQNDKGQIVVSYDISESVSSQVRLIANKSAFEFSFRFWLILSSTIFTLFISLKYRTAITPVFSLSSAILRSFDWIHCNWSPSPVDLIQKNDGEVIKGRIMLSIFFLKQMCLYPIAIHCFKCRIMKQHMKDQLCRISGSEFYTWLFGSERFSGLSRNRPLLSIPTSTLNVR